MSFRVGQRVVCIDAGPEKTAPDHRWVPGEEPVEGQTYTVRRCFADGQGELLLWLNEVCRAPLSRALYGEDAGYGAFRFRPVVERKTDISIFTKMLDTTRVNEPV